jgi:hypothetical protein
MFAFRHREREERREASGVKKKECRQKGKSERSEEWREAKREEKKAVCTIIVSCNGVQENNMHI